MVAQAFGRSSGEGSEQARAVTGGGGAGPGALCVRVRVVACLG